MVNNGIWIGGAQTYARSGEFDGRSLPWAMDQLVGQARQFGDPAADIIALRIEFLALAKGVENPEIG